MTTTSTSRTSKRSHNNTQRVKQMFKNDKTIATIKSEQMWGFKYYLSTGL